MEKPKREDKIPYHEKLKEVSEILKNNKISQIVVHGGNKKEMTFEWDKKDGTKEIEKRHEWEKTPDLDGESALLLFNLLNKKPLDQMYKEGAKTFIAPKGKEKGDLEEVDKGIIIYIDNGNKWFEIEKEGKKTRIYLDHHGKGRGPNTSATKMIYDLLKTGNPKIDEEYPWLSNYVNNVNNLDNLNYINRDYFNEEHFKKIWPYTLNNIGRQMKAVDLINLFKSGILNDFSKSTKQILDQEIELEKDRNDGQVHKEKIKFGDIILKNGKTINQQIGEDVGEGGNIDKTISGIYATNKFKSDLLGNVVFQEYKRIIPDHLAFIGTKACGYDTYTAWNEKKHKFFINSNEEGLAEIVKKLNEADPGCVLDVRGVMIFGEIKNLTKDRFKEILGLNNENKINKTKNTKKSPENPILEQEIEEKNKRIAFLKESVAKRAKEIEDRAKEIEDRAKKIKELEAIILALPDDEPEENLTLPKSETSEPEKVEINENKENKITSEDFKELVRLSKFFLENPKEPTTVGSIITKYPELFEEINTIERERQEKLKEIDEREKLQEFGTATTKNMKTKRDTVNNSFDTKIEMVYIRNRKELK